jgi:hypothetical protein
MYVGFVMRVNFVILVCVPVSTVLCIVCTMFFIVSFMCMFPYLFCLYCHRVEVNNNNNNNNNNNMPAWHARGQTPLPHWQFTIALRPRGISREKSK